MKRFQQASRKTQINTDHFKCQGLIPSAPEPFGLDIDQTDSATYSHTHRADLRGLTAEQVGTIPKIIEIYESFKKLRAFCIEVMSFNDEPEREGLLDRPKQVVHRGLWAAATLVVLCGMGTLIALQPKKLLRGGTSSTVSLAKSMAEQIKNPQCPDFPKLEILEVTHNNLANMGPGSGKEGLEYHVRTATGKEMIMDLHAKREFKSDDPDSFGMHGAYGTINVAGPSEALIVVSFRDWKTKEPLLVDDFSLSFFDLDHGPHGDGLEALTIEGDWSMVVVAKDTSVLVHHTEDTPRRITFQATEESKVLDDPSDPNSLTLDQFNKAITVRFQHAKQFLLGMHVKTNGDFARVFEFIGVASMLCAKSPTNEELPIGEVYVNQDQMKKVGGGVKVVEEETNWWWVLAALILGALLACLLVLCCLPKKEPEYREMAPVAEPPVEEPTVVEPPRKQGPGIFSVTLAAGPGVKLGLHLDAPEGIQQPPMIKKVLEGAIQSFNQQDEEFAIESFDMIVKVGDVEDPSLLKDELLKGLPAEAKLTLDRPYRIETELNGDLGVKLDAMKDSYGAVIMDIEAHGSIAKYNSDNPSMKINKGDRIISVNGSTFDPKKGWTPRSGGTPKKSAFGSRATSRFLEEMEDFKDKEIEVMFLKYTTFEKSG